MIAEIGTFLGPMKLHRAVRRVPFGAQKSLSVQSPPTCPSNGFARIKSTTYGAVYIIDPKQLLYTKSKACTCYQDLPAGWTLCSSAPSLDFQPSALIDSQPPPSIITAKWSVEQVKTNSQGYVVLRNDRALKCVKGAGVKLNTSSSILLIFKKNNDVDLLNIKAILKKKWKRASCQTQIRILTNEKRDVRLYPILSRASLTLMIMYRLYTTCGKYGVKSPKFIWAPCAQLYSLSETPQPPPSARIWAHIRGRYWSAKIDDICLWAPGTVACTVNYVCNGTCLLDSKLVWFCSCSSCRTRCSAPRRRSRSWSRDNKMNRSCGSVFFINGSDSGISVLWILITLMRIRIRLIALMWIRMRIWIFIWCGSVTDPSFQIKAQTLRIRIRMRIHNTAAFTKYLDQDPACEA